MYSIDDILRLEYIDRCHALLHDALSLHIKALALLKTQCNEIGAVYWVLTSVW